MLEIYNGRDKFYQWDVGQRLIVDDTIIAVHYDNGTGDALVCGVYEYEGQYVADVPNIMLQTVWAIKCYAYCGECVRAEKVYEVEKRSRPDDYIYTETETLRYSSLLEMINATNDDLATVEQSLEASIAENADNIAAVNYGFLEYKEETNKKIYDNTVKLVGVESDLEIHVDNIYESLNEHKAKLNQQDNRMSAIEQKHNAEIEDVENQIGKTNTQYATLYNTVNTNANSLTNLTQNYYAFKNDSTAKLTNHENRITTLEKSGGSGTGGGGVNATPDWNENNPDSPAYIKNRTHYETTDSIELLAECKPEIQELDGMPVAVFASPIGLQAGKTYKVYWNGVEYERTAADMSEVFPSAGMPVMLLGNYGLMLGGESTGEPFLIMDAPPDLVEETGALIYVLDGSTELTIRIDAYGGIVKIDNKYLDLSAYAKTEYVNEVKVGLEGLFPNYYPKTTIDNKFNNQFFTTGGNGNLTGKNEGYQAAVGQIEELITYVEIPAAAANDEYLLTLGYSSSKTDLMCQYQTEGGIVAGEMRKLKFYVRRIGKHIFIKIYKPSANGFTDVIEDVLFIDKSETQTNPRYVRISTVSGNNFPDGAKITMYQRTAAKAVN